MISTPLWKRGRALLSAVGGLCLLLSGAFLLAPAADHRDGPIFSNTQQAGQGDINDIYTFVSPSNSSNTVLILTFQPFPGVLSPTTTDPMQTYDIHIDRSNPLDAIEEITFRVTYGAPDSNGVQPVTLTGLPASNFPPNGILAQGKTGQNIQIRTGGMFRSAIHDDPFFFDGGAAGGGGFNAAVAAGNLTLFPRPVGQARNFFGPNVNTFAIIIEIPSTKLTPTANGVIGVWATISKNGVQNDRMGRPAVNTGLIPPIPRNNLANGERRTAFNQGLPRNDRRDFKADMVSVLTNPKFYWNETAATADAVSNLLLPDMLVFQIGNTAGYGTFVTQGSTQFFGNGRKLTDAVIDTTLQVLTGNATLKQNVPDDNGFRVTDGTTEPISGQHRAIAFPYIGAANLPLNGPGTGPNP
jgi:hypothetical protein